MHAAGRPSAADESRTSATIRTHRTCNAHAKLLVGRLCGSSLRTAGMAAHEGAFTPSEDAAREQRYLRYYGKSMPFFSKMMLALQDNPSDTRAFYKEHLSKASEAASLRKLVTSLPVRDEGEATKPARNVTYQQAKASLDAKPRGLHTMFKLYE